jgi:molybdopterin biosynthesis enzyme
MPRGERPSPGDVLAQDVRGTDGSVALRKGRVLSEEDVRQLDALVWNELHVLAMERGDVHEDAGGRRLATAAAGDGVEAQGMSAGAYPLVAKRRGVLRIDAARLAQVNEIDDLALYALPDGYVAVDGEVVGRAKVVPFVTREEGVARAEALAAGGLVRVQRFVPARVAMLVEEAVDEATLGRARRDFEEKLAFFGSELVRLDRVEGGAPALAAALRDSIDSGAQVVILAGSKPLDPLDPVLGALERAGVRMEKYGVPAHPGTLLWLAYAGEVPVVGAPTCGLFSKATAFDLVLPLLLTGERLGRAQLAGLAAGGLLTREVSFRLPPYRQSSARGTVDAG